MKRLINDIVSMSLWLECNIYSVLLLFIAIKQCYIFWIIKRRRESTNAIFNFFLFLLYGLPVHLYYLLEINIINYPFYFFLFSEHMYVYLWAFQSNWLSSFLRYYILYYSYVYNYIKIFISCVSYYIKN